MKMLKLFTGKKENHRPDKNDDKRNKKTKKKRNSSATSKSSSASTSLLPGGSMEFQTTNEHVAAEWMDLLNSHWTKEELLGLFTSPKAPAIFEDGQTMSVSALSDELQNLFTGFENLRFSFESIKELRPGEVLVNELVVSGTHTGDLRFGGFPVVPATLKEITLDPELMWLTIDDGKIARIEIIALGNLTGPQGMYLSVGGSLDSPPISE